MTHRLSCLTFLIVATCCSGLVGCRGHNNAYTKQLTGSVDASDIHETGQQQPRQVPKTVYVADFALDAESLTGDQGVRGVLPGGMNQGMLGGIGQRLPHPLASGDPAQRSRQIIDTLAQALVESLYEHHVPAQRIDARNSALPADGWLLQGMFTEVDEGNRIKRAVIGFGQGATRMDVQVGISNLASAEPRKAFIVFGTVKDPGKMPGAIVTMNPYVAAAKFVMEKNATARDIHKTADQIIEVLMGYETTIKERAGIHR